MEFEGSPSPRLQGVESLDSRGSRRLGNRSPLQGITSLPSPPSASRKDIKVIHRSGQLKPNVDNPNVTGEFSEEEREFIDEFGARHFVKRTRRLEEELGTASKPVVTKHLYYGPPSTTTARAESTVHAPKCCCHSNAPLATTVVPQPPPPQIVYVPISVPSQSPSCCHCCSHGGCCGHGRSTVCCKGRGGWQEGDDTGVSMQRPFSQPFPGPRQVTYREGEPEAPDAESTPQQAPMSEAAALQENRGLDVSFGTGSRTRTPLDRSTLQLGSSSRGLQREEDGEEVTNPFQTEVPQSLVMSQSQEDEVFSDVGFGGEEYRTNSVPMAQRPNETGFVGNSMSGSAFRTGSTKMQSQEEGVFMGEAAQNYSDAARNVCPRNPARQQKIYKLLRPQPSEEESSGTEEIYSDYVESEQAPLSRPGKVFVDSRAPLRPERRGLPFRPTPKRNVSGVQPETGGDERFTRPEGADTPSPKSDSKKEVNEEEGPRSMTEEGERAPNSNEGVSPKRQDTPRRRPKAIVGTRGGDSESDEGLSNDGRRRGRSTVEESGEKYPQTSFGRRARTIELTIYVLHVSVLDRGLKYGCPKRIFLKLRSGQEEGHTDIVPFNTLKKRYKIGSVFTLHCPVDDEDQPVSDVRFEIMKCDKSQAGSVAYAVLRLKPLMPQLMRNACPKAGLLQRLPVDADGEVVGTLSCVLTIQKASSMERAPDVASVDMRGSLASDYTPCSLCHVRAEEPSHFRRTLL